MINNLKKKLKGRMVIAVLITIALEAGSFLAVQSEGLSTGKLLLALLLSISAGVLFFADFKIRSWGAWIGFLVLPFGALCCMEFFTHVPWDLSVLITILNYLFYLILYLILTFLTGNMKLGCALAPLFPAFAGTVNYFVVAFRSSPVVPWDLYSLGTAASVADSYNIEMSYRLYFVLVGFVFLAILGSKLDWSLKKKWKLRIAALVVSVFCMAGFVNFVQTKTCKTVFGLDDILFTPNVLYRNNGFMVAYLANLQYLNIEKPDGYSKENATKLAESVEKEETASEDTDTPNILVIMNEAFSDLSVYGDFQTSEEYMPFFNSLKENTVRGQLYVSVKGGNTANTEFEFLTGNSMAFLPTGSIPYQQFISDDMPSLASWLGGLGYDTAALHPYNASGWNRNKVYEYFGFQNQYFKSTADFGDATTLRGFVDDQSAFDKLKALYEEKEQGKKLFAFEVTMQNHGGYSKEYEDLSNDITLTDADRSGRQIQTAGTEKYLTLLKKTDEAFEDLLDYFSKQEEKTIIVMFGDHQPSDYICNTVLNLFGKTSDDLENGSAEELSTKYEVPVVIWANYDIKEEENISISANYLSSLVLQTAQVPLSDYQQYLNTLREDYPVITANFYKQASDETFYRYKEQPESEGLRDYSILEYNDLVDKKNRLTAFFGG